MRVLLCDPNPQFLQTITSLGHADYISISNPGEAMGVNQVNIALISNDIGEWEFLAKHFVGQGVVTFIMADNISDINLWKKTTELGCKGLWAKDKVLQELPSKLTSNARASSGNRRPLREQLSRTSPTTPKASPSTMDNPFSSPKQQFSSYKAQQNKQAAIVVRRELICFFGVNGGVSKTTMAINTGVSLSKQGQSVVLVDFDVFSGDVATRLKVKPSTTMVDMIKGNTDHISQCLVDHSSGLKILPAPLNHEEGSLITPEVSAKILSSLTKLFDVVIVDTAPLLIAPTLVTMEHATKVYILTPPDASTVAKTKSILERLDLLAFERHKFKMLVTKMPKKPPLRINDMTSVLNLELAGVIPYDEGVQLESNLGTPPVLSRRAKNFSKAVNTLCHSIIPNSQANAVGFSFLNIFKRKGS